MVKFGEGQGAANNGYFKITLKYMHMCTPQNYNDIKATALVQIPPAEQEVHHHCMFICYYRHVPLHVYPYQQQIEAKVILTRLLQTFKVTPDPSYKIAVEQLLTQHPKGGIPCTLQEIPV